MMFPVIYFSRTISFFTISIIFFMFILLLEKNDFMVIQNFWLSEILLTLITLKCFSLVWRSNLTQKFLCFLYLSQVSSDLFLLNLFLSLELSVIAFLRDLVVKALLLKRRTFTLTSGILFKSSRKTYWRVD